LNHEPLSRRASTCRDQKDVEAVRSAKPDGERRWSASAAGLFQIKHHEHPKTSQTTPRESRWQRGGSPHGGTQAQRD